MMYYNLNTVALSQVFSVIEYLVPEWQYSMVVDFWKGGSYWEVVRLLVASPQKIDIKEDCYTRSKPGPAMFLLSAPG